MPDKKKGAAVALLLTCGLLGPQTGEAEEVVDLIPFIALKQEYNDNIFLDADDEVDDFITTVSPGFEVAKVTERLDARLLARLDGLLYWDNDDLNAVDQLYSGVISHRATPLLTLGGEASYVRDSRADREIEDTGLILGTQKRDDAHIGLSADYMATEKTTLGLAAEYNNEEFEEDDTDGRSADSDSAGGRLELSHDISSAIPGTVATAQLGYTNFDAVDADVDNYYAAVGAKRAVTELVTLSGYVGGRYTRADLEEDDDGDEGDDAGPIASLTVERRGETGRQRLTVTHDVISASGRRSLSKRDRKSVV